MDLDRFLALNRPVWDRLAELTRRADRGVGNLSPAETDELIRLYQRTSTHLSVAQTSYRDAWVRSQREIRKLIPLAAELKVIIGIEDDGPGVTLQTYGAGRCGLERVLDEIRNSAAQQTSVAIE